MVTPVDEEIDMLLHKVSLSFYAHSFIVCHISVSLKSKVRKPKLKIATTTITKSIPFRRMWLQSGEKQIVMQLKEIGDQDLFPFLAKPTMSWTDSHTLCYWYRNEYFNDHFFQFLIRNTICSFRKSSWLKIF